MNEYYKPNVAPYATNMALAGFYPAISRIFWFWLIVVLFGIADLFYKNERKTQHFFSEMLLIKKDLLLQFLDFSERSGDWDLMDMIQDNINLLKIRGIEHKGYLKRINNLSS